MTVSISFNLLHVKRTATITELTMYALGVLVSKILSIYPVKSLYTPFIKLNVFENMTLGS